MTIYIDCTGNDCTSCQRMDRPSCKWCIESRTCSLNTIGCPGNATSFAQCPSKYPIVKFDEISRNFLDSLISVVESVSVERSREQQYYSLCCCFSFVERSDWIRGNYCYLPIFFNEISSNFQCAFGNATSPAT